MDISDAEALDGANILRENKEILLTLRLRITDIESGLSGLLYSNQDVRDGLRNFAKEDK